MFPEPKIKKSAAPPWLAKVPESQRKLLAALVEEHGLARASAIAGVGRETTLAVMARRPVRRGTHAILDTLDSRIEQYRAAAAEQSSAA